MKAKDHARVWSDASRLLIDRKDLFQGQGNMHGAELVRSAEYLAYAVSRAYEAFAKEQEEQGD